MTKGVLDTVTANTNCNAAGHFCNITTNGTKQVFNTTGRPLDAGRVRMDLAVAASYVNNPGNYTDTLTFVAVPTY